MSNGGTQFNVPLRRRMTTGIALAVFSVTLMGFLFWRTRRLASTEANLVTTSSTLVAAIFLVWSGFAIHRDMAEEKLTVRTHELSRKSQELTRSREAFESQSRMLRSVLDSMAEGLVATDEQGKFIIWNPAAERIVGMGAASLSSQQWSEHYGLFLDDMVTPFPPDQNPLLLAIRGEISTAQMFVRNPQLTEGAWIEANAGPLKDQNGVVCGGVVAFRDITEKRNSEREIQKAEFGTRAPGG
jgi:PAS domain S-box-containing protein